jgi:biopolymer transport protein ExbD
VRRRVFHAPHPFGDINVTPLIDVVMCMIVFYLIVGKLAADVRSPMRLPEARHAEKSARPEMLVINVLPGDAGARIEVESAGVDLAVLPAAIRARLAEQPETVVQVRASRDLAYGAVKPVIDACRDAGLPAVRLAAERVP